MSFMTQLFWERLSLLINRMRSSIHQINSLKKLRLFAFIIIAVLSVLSSCKKPVDGLGKSIQPEDDLINAIQTDTTSLFAKTVKVDSVTSDFYSNIMIGNYVDSDFGVVRARGVLQFIPSTSKPRYADNIRIDSVVLSLTYQNATYGKNVPMSFNVRELMDDLEYDDSYYSNSKVTTGFQNLMKPGMEIQDPNPEIASVSGLDYTPALRLQLRHSLGEKLLTADTSVLDDANLFKSFFSGLVIGSETIDGQVINYVQSDAASKLTVYYAELGGTEEILNSADFIVSKSSCKAFTQIEHHYNGTSLQGINNTNDIDGSQYCYLQSGEGTRVAIDISSVNWLNDYKGVTINKAELIIPYDNISKYSPLNSILVFYKPENSEYFTYAQTGGNVNVSTGLYRINLTAHIQEYLTGNIDTDEILLQPVYTLSQYSNSWSVARSLLHGPEYSSDIKQNMRLVITYSY